MKRIVVPGEKVFDEPKRGDALFVDQGATYATTVSLACDDRVIPLKGYYLPRVEDYVIGIVKEQTFTGYVVDLNSPYEGRLSDRSIREELRIGDVVSAKIDAVNEVHEAVLEEPRRFWGGEVMEIEHVKVPRVIGRNASMLSTIREYTNSQVFVGKNGRVYLKDGNTALASMAILKICREAHTSGLTERVIAFLASESKKGETK